MPGWLCYCSGMPSKFVVAMIVYAVLALIAIVVLEGRLRLFMVVFMGALAFRTYIARRAGW